jgi:hypothetical protein
MKSLNKNKYTLACVICLLIAIISIIYVSNIVPTLKVELTLKEHNEKFFVNFDKEQFSVLKSSHYFDKKETKDNSEQLKEIGPIPEGKFVSSFDGKGEGKYGYWKPYLAMGSRAVYYTEKVPQRYLSGEIIRDYYGRIEYEEVEKVKYVNEPYWDSRYTTIPYEYTYTFSVIDLSDSISSNASDSIYSICTKQFAKQLTSYKNWNFSPNQVKCRRNANWAKFYMSVLPKNKVAVVFQSKDEKGVSVIRAVYFANRKAYVLDVHSPYELIENANAIMETFTTFYLQDYNDMVSMRLLLTILGCIAFVVFGLICLLIPKIVLQNRETVLPKQAKYLVRYACVMWFVNIICVFADVYPIFTGELRQDSYWWNIFLLFLCAVGMNIFTNMYVVNKAKAENEFDYLIPKWLKFYLIKRHITDAEYKSVVVFLLYPFFILGNLPFGICVLGYILPVAILSVILMEVRIFSKWTHEDTNGNNSNGVEELGVFKDYYLLLDINRDASEMDIDIAFNKAMAKYNSRTDAKLYNEVYKRNIQEAYRVLSSTNRLKPEYDKEFDAYRASNDSEYLYSDERTKRDIMLVQKELRGTLLASKKYDTCAKVHNLVIRAVVIYGVFLAIVSSILFVPVKKHTTFGDVYWESLWDKVRFIDD